MLASQRGHVQQSIKTRPQTNSLTYKLPTVVFFSSCMWRYRYFTSLVAASSGLTAYSTLNRFGTHEQSPRTRTWCSTSVQPQPFLALYPSTAPPPNPPFSSPHPRLPPPSMSPSKSLHPLPRDSTEALSSQPFPLESGTARIGATHRHAPQAVLSQARPGAPGPSRRGCCSQPGKSLWAGRPQCKAQQGQQQPLVSWRYSSGLQLLLAKGHTTKASCGARVVRFVDSATPSQEQRSNRHLLVKFTAFCTSAGTLPRYKFPSPYHVRTLELPKLATTRNVCAVTADDVARAAATKE